MVANGGCGGIRFERTTRVNGRGQPRRHDQDWEQPRAGVNQPGAEEKAACRVGTDSDRNL